MQFQEYQEASHEFAVYPQDHAPTYPILGLAGEAGELCNKYKKIIRGDDNQQEIIEGIVEELGDCLWYLSECCTQLGLSLSDVATLNIQKLEMRRERDSLLGSGDKR